MPVFDLSYTVRDFSREKSTVTFRVDVADLTELATARTAFYNALNAVTNGAIESSRASLLERYAPVAVTDHTAHRENKIFVGLADTVTGRAFNLTIPVFNLDSIEFDPQSDNLVQSDPQASALLTAIQDNHVSVEGNPVLATTFKFVGRNL